MMSGLVAGLLTFLREAFSVNLGLKSLSLAFAFGLFIYQHGQQALQQRTVPVDVVQLPPKDETRVLMSQLPGNLQVTLRGSSRAIDSLIRTGIQPVEIDLRTQKKTSIEFNAEMLSVPEDVEVVFIDPPRIDLEWQEITTRQVQLQSSISGQPAAGYVVKGEPEVEPKTLLAKGPASLVEVIQYARLAPFDVSGLTEGTYPRRIAIDGPPSRVSFLGPQSAAVKVTISRRLTEKTFTRPIEVVGVAGGFSAPRSAEVTVIGPPEVVNALRPEQVVPRADLMTVPNFDLKAHPRGALAVKVTVELANAEAQVQPPSVTVRW
jgi:hypothetical protein